MQSFKVMPSRSGTMRPWDQRIILDVFSNHTCAVSLSGIDALTSTSCQASAGMQHAAVNVQH